MVSIGPFQYIDAAVITATISGTGAVSLDEAEIVAGGETIIITLAGATWVASGATFDAVRQDIIDGMTSAGSESTGWNNEVRDNLAVTTVVRTSSTVVTVTLSAQSAYDITAGEDITVTVPASAISGSSPVVATPSFRAHYISDEYTVTLSGGGGSRNMLLVPDSTWTLSEVNALNKFGKVKGLTSGAVHNQDDPENVDWPNSCDATYNWSYCQATYDSLDLGSCSANFTDYIRWRIRKTGANIGRIDLQAHADRDPDEETWWGDQGFQDAEKARYIT